MRNPTTIGPWRVHAPDHGSDTVSRLVCDECGHEHVDVDSAALPAACSDLLPIDERYPLLWRDAAALLWPLGGDAAVSAKAMREALDVLGGGTGPGISLHAVAVLVWETWQDLGDAGTRSWLHRVVGDDPHADALIAELWDLTHLRGQHECQGEIDLDEDLPSWC